MQIYLDDNIADPRLVAILSKQGHEVTSPVDTGTEGFTDAKRLIQAITTSCVVLTRDVDDFEDLHNLIVAARGEHPSILLAYSAADPTRNLTPRGIANAIGKLEASGAEIANGLHSLNEWR